MFKKIVKRDGKIVDFNLDKITGLGDGVGDFV